MNCCPSLRIAAPSMLLALALSISSVPVASKPKEISFQTTTTQPYRPDSVRPAVMTGRVVTTGGTAVPDAQVRVYNDTETSTSDKATVRTDGLGYFAAPGVIPSTAVAIAEHTALGFGRSTPFPVRDAVTTLSDVVLLQWGAVSGIVVGPDQQPVAGARVRGSFHRSFGTQASTAYAVTAEDGTFRLDKVHPQPLTIEVHKEGFPVSSVSTNVPPGGSQTGLRLALERPLTISGRVVDETGRPLAHSPIEAGNGRINATATTDAKGRFVLAPLSSGKYSITARDQTWTVHSTVHSIEAGSTDVEIAVNLAVAAAERVAQVVFRGRVIDEETKQPVHAGLKVRSLTEHTKYNVAYPADKPGEFEIRFTRAEHIAINFVVEAEGYAPEYSRQLEVPQQEAMFGRVFPMEKSKVLRGRIVDTAGKPMAETLVQLMLPGRRHEVQPVTRQAEVRTGPDGHFTFRSVSSGVRILEILPPSPLLAMDHIGVIEPDAAETDFGDIAVNPGGGLTVKVARGPDRIPLTNAAVTLSATEPERVDFMEVGRTDAQGVAFFRGIPPGSYSATVNSPSGNTQFSRIAKLRAGDVKTAEIVFGQDRVRVGLRRGGKHVEGIVGVWPLDSPDLLVSQSARDGIVEITDLPPGQYVFSGLHISQNVFNEKVQELVRPIVNGENPDVLLDFPNGTISGMVVDRSGKPVHSVGLWLVTGAGNSGKMRSAERSAPVVFTDKLGRFQFDTLKPGTYQILARKSNGGTAQSAPLVLGGASNPSMETRLVLNNDGGSLTAKVLDSRNGNPIQHADCVLHRDGAWLWRPPTWDLHGGSYWTDVPPGTYVVEVGAHGYASRRQQVEIKSGERTQIEATLSPGAYFSWRIQPTGRIELSNVTLQVIPDDLNSTQEPKSGRPNDHILRRGGWWSASLIPGAYTATAQVDGQIVATEKFTINAGNDLRLETILRAP